MSTNIKMLQISGDKEIILDLEDAPDVVLMDFCRIILRHHDLRNPESQNFLRQLNAALKVKSEKEPAGSHASERYYLKEAIAEIDNILNRLAQEEKA